MRSTRSAACRRRSSELRPHFPPGLEAQIAFDNVGVVRESIIEVLKTLGEAIVLVVLVLFLFLQNWRSTLIPAITIPVSLIGTFAFMKLLGFSINTLTLFGLVLATGTVVDDAIVVIENIERHMREYGKSAIRASVDAMAEVFSAVVVIGIVLVAVFVPVAFFPGITGRMYQQFSITIACAVIISVFNAVTLTPALSALLLGHEVKQQGMFFRGREPHHRRRDAHLHAADRGLLRWELAMLVIFAVGLWGTYTVYRAVPSSFVPAEDEGYFIAIIQAPSGASLDYTTGLAQQAEKIVMADPQVLAVFSVAGFSFSGAAPNQGLMFARLRSYEERREPSQSLTAVIGRLQGQLFGGITGGLVIPVAPPSLQGVSQFGGFQMEIVDNSGGPIERLAQVTGDVIGRGNQSGRVAGLFSSFTADDPQLVVDIDRDRARGLNLPMSAVTDTLQVLLGIAVRERLRLQQPRVSRVRAGRPGVPVAAGQPAPVLRANDHRRHGAARHGRPAARNDGALGHQSLQPAAVGRDHGIAVAGRQLRSGHPADAADRGRGAAARVSVCLGRVSRSRKSGRARRPC